MSKPNKLLFNGFSQKKKWVQILKGYAWIFLNATLKRGFHSRNWKARNPGGMDVSKSLSWFLCSLKYRRYYQTCICNQSSPSPHRDPTPTTRVSITSTAELLLGLQAPPGDLDVPALQGREPHSCSHMCHFIFTHPLTIQRRPCEPIQWPGL